MAKFQTHVAGVTHYDIDYSSIKRASKVRLVPEPTNQYDSFAIRVNIDGKPVGYVKRGFNKTLIDEIERGCKVSARVRAVVGGGEGMNHGIVLDVIVDDGQTAFRKTSALGAIQGQASREIKVSRSRFLLRNDPLQAELWIRFLEKTKRVPRTEPYPAKPDYEDEYRRSTSWLSRVFNSDFDRFKARRRDKYQQRVRYIQARNRERQQLIEEHSAKRKSITKEFEEFADKFRVRSILAQINASSSGEANERSPFVSVYERSLFQEIKRHVRFALHQVKLDEKHVDILCITEDGLDVWAIEVDGGIHRRENKIESDHALEEHLQRIGVSLIRVPNSVVSRDVESCCKEILAILNTGSSV